MNKTKIEWCDYTINPVKGLCPMACSYCYARAMYKRFNWNPIVRYDDWVWHEGGHIPSGSKVFVGSTMELFGKWIKKEWLEIIFSYCRSVPSVNFIFLTKQPQNLIKYSPFPDNCWIGVSATDQKLFYEATKCLVQIKAAVRFVSIEPLLGGIFFPAWIGDVLDWVIVGQQTPIRSATTPKIAWIQDIVQTRRKALIPIFLKNNLSSIIEGRKLIQEMPK